MKFVHAADLHLDSPLVGLQRYEGAPVERLRLATRRAAENLVSLCLDERVAFLLIAGDLFDGAWKDYDTGLFFARQMRRLKEGGVRVFIVRGNHDAASKVSRELRLPDNVHLFDTRSAGTVHLQELGVAIHGRSYAKEATTEDLSATYPEPSAGVLNIGLLHTALDGREDHAPYAPCKVDGLISRGYDYWALGHVHEHEVVHADPWIVFPGNLQGRHARETDAKGACLVTVHEGVITAVQHRTLDVVRWVQCVVDAGGAANIQEVLTRVSDALSAALAEAEDRLVAARVTVTGRTAAHAALTSHPRRYTEEVRVLAIDLGGDDLWVEKVRLQTRSDFDLDELRGGEGPIAALLRHTAQLRGDQPAVSFLARTLSDLSAKLPAQARAPGELAVDDPEAVAGLLDEVDHLLVGRLLDLD